MSRGKKKRQRPSTLDRAVGDVGASAKQVGNFAKKNFTEDKQLYWVYGGSLVLFLLYGVYYVGDKIRMEYLGGNEELAAQQMSYVEKWSTAYAGAPEVVDVDGDGTPDFLGTYRGIEPAGDYLAAFRAKDGKVLWRSGPHDLTSNHRYFSVAGDRVLIVDRLRNGVILDLKTGNKQHSLKAPHVTLDYCPAPDGTARVQLKSYKQHVQVDLKTGAISPADAGWCKESVAPGGPRNVAEAERPADPGKWEMGMSDGAYAALLGHVDKRWHVAGFDSALTKEIWRVPLPAGRQAAGIDVRGDTVYITTHGGTQGNPLVRAMSAKDGKVRWEAKLTKARSDYSWGIAASPKHVFAAHGGALSVLDAATGKTQYSVGDLAEE